MRMSRYLDAKAFCDEAAKLKAVTGRTSPAVLERLEEQRSLIPRLRLHYPDAVERRWWALAHPAEVIVGLLEPNGERWNDACALEEAHQANRFDVDPRQVAHALDDPEPRFVPFIERPAERPFVPWRDYRVAVTAGDDGPLHTNDTVVTYYSSWQLLQFAEVANMGVVSFMNLLETREWPTDADVAVAPRAMSFLPIHAMRGFAEHAPALDALVWFAEEDALGFAFATRGDHRRRMLTEDERDEIMRLRLWAAAQARSRHGVEAEQLRAATLFLCERWDHWTGEGRPLIADAYKSIAAPAVRLACLTTGMTADEYGEVLGHALGDSKPILRRVWPNWAADQRATARRILVGYRRPDALLQAAFADDLVDRFLDFIEAYGLHGFYWRMESFMRHSFKGNDHAPEGLKGDVQGMAVIVEHLASALGARRQSLYEKFKELWSGDAAVLKLLKNNAVRSVAHDKHVDLDWFEAQAALGPAEQIAADLAITYAIRGGAHRVIAEDNPLRLERMMLIMLRAAVRTFEAVVGRAGEGRGVAPQSASRDA